MQKWSLLFFSVFSGVLISFSFLQENEAPIVKIIDPKNNGFYLQDVAMPYNIQVSDKEDGDSQYDEIAAGEVMLVVRYIADSTKVSTFKKDDLIDAAELLTIRSSNCLNCHAFDSKLIGPSFSEIGKMYSDKSENITLLAKRIIEGSSGVWGSASMPSHPEIKEEEAKRIVSWIIKNSNDKNVTYYTGTTGTLRIKSPEPVKSKSVFMLSATYTDHGLPGEVGQRKTGRDIIVIHFK
jgi:cytochrome c